MTYSKHAWTDDEIITKEKLNNVEEGINTVTAKVEAIEPELEKKIYKPSSEGATGKVLLWKETNQTEWKELPKLDKIDALDAEDGATLKNAFNTLIADLKAKGYMNNQ